ncbi:hypothetical protein [Deinococcus sp.]
MSRRGQCFLHAKPRNTIAVHTFRQVGFTERTGVDLTVLCAP